MFFKFEFFKKINKFLLINLLNNSSVKKGCFLFINILKFFFKRVLLTKVKLNNKCVYTGKSNAFENKFMNSYQHDYIIKMLGNGYKPSDIFILAPSIKSGQSPARTLENKIKLLNPEIPVYVPTNDDEKLDESIIENKLLFSTFHQAKGLERKIVILYGFDSSYFVYYNKHKPTSICPEEIYVAATRSKEHTLIVHHCGNEFLPFINAELLEKYCDLVVDSPIYLSRFREKDTKTYSVTQLVSNLSFANIDKIIGMLDIKHIRNKSKQINIPYKIEAPSGPETVSDINGIAIPAYYEYSKLGKMSIINYLKNEGPFEFDNTAYDINYLLYTKSISEITMPEYLFISTVFSSITSGYLFKTLQIQSFDWLDSSSVSNAIKNIDSLNLSTNTYFEKKVMTRIIYGGNMTVNISGFIDCIDDDSKHIFEFKCIDGDLKPENIIQLALYAYIYETTNSLKEHKLPREITDKIAILNSEIKDLNKKMQKFKSPEYRAQYEIIITEKLKEISKLETTHKKTNKYLLYNILTDELIEISSSYENLKEIIKTVILAKLEPPPEISDFEFIQNAKQICDKYSSS